MNLPSFLAKQYPFKTDRFFQLPNGPKLHYIDEGIGEPIVMLHGNPTWSFYFRNLIKELSPYGRCLVPDHIGCGLSEKPLKYPYSLQTHIENTIAWLENLKIGRFHLIVHDWGGAIGMGIAVRWPARVKSMVILNSAAFLSPSIPLRIAACRLPLFGPFLVKVCNAFVRGATWMATKKALSKEVKEGYIFPYQRIRERVAVNAFVQDIPMSPEHPSYDILQKIEENLWVLTYKPILIAWGNKDFCFNGEFLRRWQQIFGQAQTKLFPNAGHYVLEDARDEINLLIRQFIVSHQAACTYEGAVAPATTATQEFKDA